MSAPVALDDWEALAAERLDPGAYAYIAGGAGDEVTLAENREAFRRLRIEPRVLRGQAGRTTATTVLGTEVAAPALVAPMAYQGAFHPDAECATAKGAAAAGTLVIDNAVAAGYRALVVTVDVPVLGRRDRDTRSGFALPPHLRLPSVPIPAGSAGPVTPALVSELMNPDLTWDDISRLAARGPLPVVVKGVLCPADADLAAAHGAVAVVVSNHGGRQLDTVPATADALSRVAEAVDGRLEIYLDGGVRRGTDVLKALAPGARAVLVGRPIAYGLAVGGADGVRAVLATLREETDNALALAGCRSPREVGREVLVAS